MCAYDKKNSETEKEHNLCIMQGGYLRNPIHTLINQDNATFVLKKNPKDFATKGYNAINI